MLRTGGAALVASAILVSFAGCAQDAAAICSSAGGTYAGGTCSRWTPRRQAAEDFCESQGGVFLTGEERCALGEGGP